MNEKVDIVYKVICKNYVQNDVAKEFRVTPMTISRIMKKAYKNPKFITELLSSRDNKELCAQRLAGQILELYNSG